MAAKTSGPVRVGIGGWTYAPWRGVFYPEGLAQRRELEFASRKLKTVEINATYHGAQKPESFAKWRDETPDGFVFAVKGPRFAANRRILAESGESIERFFASGVMELKEKLGPVNWQFMAAKQFDPADFEAFLKLLPRRVAGRAIRHAVEVRHESFRNAEFVALARAHGVAIVVAGESEHPLIADVSAPFVYARLMGAHGDEPLGYAPKTLDAWAGHARDWAAGAAPKGLALAAAEVAGAPREVFVYAIAGHKTANPAAAMALQARADKALK